MNSCCVMKPCRVVYQEKSVQTHSVDAEVFFYFETERHKACRPHYVLCFHGES